MKRIKVKQEMYPESPRCWDNLTKMVCFHNRYDLGDKFSEYKSSAFDSWEELSEQLHKDYNIAAILPLYLYDHSGITMSTGSFDCQWDSGQVGFIFITKETMIENFGGKNLTEKLKEQAVKICKADVKTYDQYLTGEVYSYVIEEGREMVTLSREDFENGNCDNIESTIEWIEIDSCGGFYGDDFLTNGILDYAGKEFTEQLKNISVEY